jgi:EcsC protein family
LVSRGTLCHADDVEYRRRRLTVSSTVLSPADAEALRQAKIVLTSPSLTARLGQIIGRPIESGLKLLPRGWNSRVLETTETALYRGLEFSVRTLGSDRTGGRSRDWLHKAVVTGSGAAAGALGFYTVLIELPFSTTVMLRSIADIARSEGHDPSAIETKLACLEVFALGGGGIEHEAAESGYWAVRTALAVTMREAAAHIAEKGLSQKGAPALVRLISSIASRFGAVVTAQAAALAIPIVGAVSGGAVNYLFMDHFQDLARAHFVIKRLERTYGTVVVREKYDTIAV